MKKTTLASLVVLSLALGAANASALDAQAASTPSTITIKYAKHLIGQRFKTLYNLTDRASVTYFEQRPDRKAFFEVQQQNQHGSKPPFEMKTGAIDMEKNGDRKLHGARRVFFDDLY